MAQKKGTKNIKVRDLKPKRDAKGGAVAGPSHGVTGPGHGVTGPGHGVTGPGHGVTRPGQGGT
jgi:hypothetical protein